MSSVILRSGASRLVATTDGGGLLEYSTEPGLNGAARHILRPASADAADPLDRALILMAPWCNRISGGGFRFGGEFFSLEPNLPPFPMPVHGNSFQSRWDVKDKTADTLWLCLSSTISEYYSYRADVRYRLGGETLTADLTLTNVGAKPMPFSAGFHPWFATTKDTQILAGASALLETDATDVPTGRVRSAPELRQYAPMPDRRMNHTLVGWNGVSVLRHSDLIVELRSEARYLHLFSPSAAAGFCCLEPQTAPPDAPNLAGYQPAVLAPTEQLSVGMQIHHRLLDVP